MLTKRGAVEDGRALETGTPHLRISFLQRTSLPGDARRQDLPRGSQVGLTAGTSSRPLRPGDSAPEVQDRQTAAGRPQTETVELRPVCTVLRVGREVCSVMILPQVHLRKPCYDFYFL